jgi:hypothetical protein
MRSIRNDFIFFLGNHWFFYVVKINLCDWLLSTSENKISFNVVSFVEMQNKLEQLKTNRDKKIVFEDPLIIRKK